jgi:hypothetical protein
MSVKEGFGNGASPSYTGSVRGTWREGSYTKDSESHEVEGSANGAFLFKWAP